MQTSKAKLEAKVRIIYTSVVIRTQSRRGLMITPRHSHDGTVIAMAIQTWWSTNLTNSLPA